MVKAQMTRYSANGSLNRLSQLDNSPGRVGRCNAAQAHRRNDPVQRIANGNSDSGYIERYILHADDYSVVIVCDVYRGSLVRIAYASISELDIPVSSARRVSPQ